ncbi:tetratricopeptide repeat protein [candidate division TA06 bacterium]|nr:tetratricopeptide repeat protein [candidate division TA06 bacterium]
MANEEIQKPPSGEDRLEQLVKTLISAQKEGREGFLKIGEGIHALYLETKTSGKKRQALLQENQEHLLKALFQLHQGLSNLNKEEEKSRGTLENLQASLERFGKQVSERMGEIALILTEFSKREEGLRKNMDEQLTSTLKTLEKFTNLEMERNEKIDQISQAFLKSHREITTFLEEERKKREEDRERERIRLAKEENDRGVAHYYRRSFDAARRSFEEATHLDPNLVEGVNNLALTLTELGEMDAAQENFKKILDKRPDFFEAYNNLGLLHYRGKNYQEAIDYFQEALKRSGNFAAAYVNLGNAQYQLEHFDEATKCWEKAMEIDPGNEEAKRAISIFKKSG